MHELVDTKITNWSDFFQEQVQRLLSPDYVLAWGLRVIYIAIIIVVSYGLLLLINLFIKKAIMPINKMTAEDNNRVMTLSTLARSCARYVVIFIAFVSILQEVGVNTTSILAGASMIGLAVGMGSQNLIRDVINGFFILMENQYDVGDTVTFGGPSGKVEALNLRSTMLRLDSGALQVIPNSSISTITNLSRQPMAASVAVPFKYDVNLLAAAALLDEICTKAGDANEYIVEGPKVVGITDLRADTFLVTVSAKVKPTTQANVEVYLRETIQLKFKEKGIKIG